MKHIAVLLSLLGLLCSAELFACTSAIIPGWATRDGRPLLWKHRDTGTLDNRLEHFKGEKYAFVGLVNSPSEGGEVWIGSNTAGFSIMNTASYCLKDDDVPASQMDREGVLMYRALEICATLSDFEHFLDTLSRPMGVEANFGCIDAEGGAAYYETDNDGYIKRDVNEMPEGYCVVTNFSVNGRRKDWKGVERFKTASAIMERQERGEDGRYPSISPLMIMNSFSRSYEHQGDSLHIPRYITSASVVIQGVRKGESADKQVMWTAIGYPHSAVMVPVPVTAEDHVPAYLKKTANSMNCELCDLSLKIKNEDVFTEGRNGAVDMEMSGLASENLMAAERAIYADFYYGLYNRFDEGKMKSDTYLKKYDKACRKFYRHIINAYKAYEQSKIIFH